MSTFLLGYVLEFSMIKFKKHEIDLVRKEYIYTSWKTKMSLTLYVSKVSICPKWTFFGLGVVLKAEGNCESIRLAPSLEGLFLGLPS